MIIPRHQTSLLEVGIHELAMNSQSTWRDRNPLLSMKAGPGFVPQSALLRAQHQLEVGHQNHYLYYNALILDL